MADRDRERLRRVERTFPRARIGAGATMVVGLLAGNERRLMVAGAPPRGARGAPAETIFEIASITKLFTATALAELHLRGTVSLDQPLQEWLPEIAVPSRRGRELRLRHLANHTSGLPSLGRPLLAKAVRNRSNPYARMSEADVLSALAGVRLRREPGRRFRYSNLGAGLLGLALARAFGGPYEAMISELVLGPLGMRETGIEVPASRRDRFAAGHNRRGNEVSHWELPSLPGAGALRSTAPDLLRLCAAALAPDSSSLAAAIELGQQPTFSRGRLKIGLGWLILPLGKQTMVGHSGATGGFRSFLGTVPAAGTGLVALTNSRQSPERFASRMLKSLSE